MAIVRALRVLCLVAVVGLATPLQAGAGVEVANGLQASIARARQEPLDDLIRDVEHAHPVAMFLLARRLFDVGRRDEAVFWFYEGQLRWRAYLRQNPDLRGPGSPFHESEGERFQRLFDTIGPEINRYALSDGAALAKTLDRVLAWDASHPDDFTPNGPAKESRRQDARDFATYLVTHPDEVKRMNDQARRQAGDIATGEDPYAGNGGSPMSTPQELLKPYDAKSFAAFRVGVTTRAEVIAALGRPEWWETHEDKTSKIGYSFDRPVIGLTTVNMSQVVPVSISFDAAHVLTKVELP
jgi:hypothetical protein